MPTTWDGECSAQVALCGGNQRTPTASFLKTNIRELQKSVIPKEFATRLQTLIICVCKQTFYTVKIKRVLQENNST